MDHEKKLRLLTVGKLLREARQSTGLTQQEVAKRLSYSSSQFVSNWERGLSLPPLDVLPRLATVLNIGTRRLVDALYEYQEALLKIQKQDLLKSLGLKSSQMR